MTGAAEMSRPWFEREMRVGCRVIYQWTCCPDDGSIVQGQIFTTGAHAAGFDLDFVEFYDPTYPVGSSCPTFGSWSDAEDWVVSAVR